MRIALILSLVLISSCKANSSENDIKALLEAKYIGTPSKIGGTFHGGEFHFIFNANEEEWYECEISTSYKFSETNAAKALVNSGHISVGESKFRVQENCKKIRMSSEALASRYGYEVRGITYYGVPYQILKSITVEDFKQGEDSAKAKVSGHYELTDLGRIAGYEENQINILEMHFYKDQDGEWQIQEY